MAFEKTWALKFKSRANRYPHMRATSNGKPVHEVRQPKKEEETRS
jgi:hypothetical protein